MTFHFLEIKFRCLVKIDPRVKQSGVSLKRNTKITKRGSPHLRHVLYFATAVAQLHDQEFKDYFLKKKAEGKSYTEATLAGSRKMTYRIYAVWRRGTPYIKDKGLIMSNSIIN